MVKYVWNLNLLKFSKLNPARLRQAELMGPTFLEGRYVKVSGFEGVIGRA